jgi:hypothetical protein
MNVLIGSFDALPTMPILTKPPPLPHSVSAFLASVATLEWLASVVGILENCAEKYAAHTSHADWAFGKIAFKQRQQTTYWPSYSRKKQSLVRVFNVAGRITKPRFALPPPWSA